MCKNLFMGFLVKFMMSCSGDGMISPPVSLDFYNPDSDTHKIFDGRTVIPLVNKVVITSDGISFNQLREQVNLVKTSATAANPFEVKGIGVFKELDLRAEPFVVLDLTQATVETDANWTETTPSDYSFINEANKPFNTVSFAYKHCLYVRSNSIVKGGVLDTKNTNIKYQIHDDSPLPPSGHSVFNNLKFKGTTQTGFNVGIGLRDNQISSYSQCESLDTGSKAMFFMHNTANQNNICVIELLEVQANNRDLILVSEINSLQNDLAIIKKCSSTKVGAKITYVEKDNNNFVFDIDSETEQTLTFETL